MNAKRTTSIAHDPDDAPRFTRDMAERAQHAVGDTVLRPANPPLRRGRPAKPEGERKEQVTLRLSPDVLAVYRAGGEGWQTRIDEALGDLVRLAERYRVEANPSAILCAIQKEIGGSFWDARGEIAATAAKVKAFVKKKAANRSTKKIISKAKTKTEGKPIRRSARKVGAAKAKAAAAKARA